MRDNVRSHRPWLAAGVLAVGLLTAACGSGGAASPGVAQVSTSAGASDSATPSTLAYAQCMRAHGIKDFPDPNSDGELALNLEPGSDLDPDNPTYKSADAACQPLMPPKQGPPAGLKEANLKYAKCMRAHGIADFPDPQPDGTLQIQAQPGSDLDPDNPQNKKANEACKQYLLDGGKGGSLNSQGDGS
jgi:hypothetical protein